MENYQKKIRISTIVFLLVFSVSFINHSCNRKIEFISTELVEFKIDHKKSNDTLLYGYVLYNKSEFNEQNVMKRLVQLYYAEGLPMPFNLESLKKLNHETSVDLNNMAGEKFIVIINFKNISSKKINFIIEDISLKWDSIKNETTQIVNETKFFYEFERNKNGKGYYIKN